MLCYKVFYLHQIVQVLPGTWKTEQFFEKITEQRQFTPHPFRATFDCVGPPCCAHPKRNRQVFGEGDRSGKCYSGRLLLNLTINVDINGILNTVNWIPRARNIRVQPVLVEMQVLKIVLTKLVSLTASSRDKEVLIECLMFIDSWLLYW